MSIATSEAKAAPRQSHLLRRWADKLRTNRLRRRLIGLNHPYDFTRDELTEMLRPLEKDDVKALFDHDPFLRNFALAHWEFANGVAEVESYPWEVVIPIADLCNASCSFCNSWLRGRKLLKLKELEAFREVLPYAAMVGLEGHGEPLIHPQFREIVKALTGLLDRRCRSYIITNAYHLDEHLDDLIEMGVNVYNISLNAATSETHQIVMDLGEDGFSRAISSIKRVVWQRENSPGHQHFAVNISMVITAENMHEVAAFVRMANDIGVDLVNLRTLLPLSGPVAGLNYHLLPAYKAPDFERHAAEAREAIAQSRVPINADPDSWVNPLFPPELEAKYKTEPPRTYSRDDAKRELVSDRRLEVNQLMSIKTRGERSPVGAEELVFETRKGDRKSWYQCWDVYNILHMNDFYFFLRPCCYMERTPGFEWIKYDGSYPFMEAWNSPAMVHLRRSLRDGPLVNMCTLCPEQKQHWKQPAAG